MAHLPVVPHLDEAYSLAQFLAHDRATATDLVLRAFGAVEPSRRGRFILLQALIAEAEIGPSDEIPDPAGMDEGFVTTESSLEEIPLVGVQAGREIRNRLLPMVLGTLPVRVRLMVWLDASGLTSASDLARVLGVLPDEAEQWARGARWTLNERLLQAASLPERRLLAAAVHVEPNRDAVRRMLDTLLEAVPTELHRRLAPDPGDHDVPKGKPPGQRSNSFRNSALLVAFILTVAVVGYGIQAFRAPEPATEQRATDAVRRAMEFASDTAPDFRTSSPEQAEVFVRDRIGWSIVSPIIEGYALNGVGIATVEDGLEVPVLVYAGGPGERIGVVAYTYAFLDRAGPTLYLDRDVQRQISIPGRFSVLDSGRIKAVVFRNRDDIFVAVTTGDAAALQNAIRFPG